MSRLAPGTELDGFRLGELLHAGGMAHLHAVSYADGRPAPFPMLMKVPLMRAGDGSENVVGFEVEHRILQVLQGPHVPRFVAAGDLAQLPYLVMEHVPGSTLQQRLDEIEREPARRPDPTTIARLGAAMARAAHSLHRQDTCHLDLKPANVLLHPDGHAVLLDFGLSWHAHHPDLLAEEMRKAIGSPPWIAPEQVVGVRGDPRSDIFAIGVMLYELATGELPFGVPQTAGGLRQRLWMDPPPPRSLRPEIPEWLQEVILRCLEPEAARRYPSAAHLALDLDDPSQVAITARGRQLRRTPLRIHLRRWLRAAGMQYRPSPLPSRQIDEVPIVMAAVPHRDASDATLYSLRQAVARSLGLRPGARLAVVTVVAPGQGGFADDAESDSAVQRRHLEMLRKWGEPLPLEAHRTSFHVIEASDVAEALVAYAVGNHVSIIVMGAATHGLQLQRFIATVPIKVAMQAPCTVILVKPSLPFAHLAALAV